MPKKKLTNIKRPNKSIHMKGNKYALGHHEGRPKEWTEELINIERLALEKWIENRNNYFFNSFLNERKLHPEHIERFCNYSKDFRDCCVRAKQIQEQRLVELAVTRKGDPNFIKFVLQNKSGWKEKSEISGDQANPLAIILDRIANKPTDSLELEYDAE